jgi:outer membrane receptor for ferrienterochelin and colicins
MVLVVVDTKGLPLPEASLTVKNTALALSNAKGEIRLSKAILPLVGVLSHKDYEARVLSISGKENTDLQIQMRKSTIDLDQVVITGQRREQSSLESITSVSSVGRQQLRFSMANDLAEGLRFSPGLRVENNCNVCGFTQIRLNGLDGPYTQILVNSRPVFNALSSVYGLEQIHPDMIERVEIVRGGGSAMYGSNAIAGTLNIITRKPDENAFTLGSQVNIWDGGIAEQQYTGLFSRVSTDRTAGLMLFGGFRDRPGYDRDQDGYTELPQLSNFNLAAQGYKNFENHWKLESNLAFMQEQRRGGSHLDLAPNLADLAEETRHRVISAQVSAEKYLPGFNAVWSTYSGFQYTDRASYYGAGGNADVLAEEGLTEDEIRESVEEAALFFGNTYDWSAQLGTQMLFDREKTTFQMGIEGIYNRVIDQMPGYERSIDQEVKTLATFSNLEYRFSSSWELSAGARLDFIDIQGQYDLRSSSQATDQLFTAFNPRVNVAYRPSEKQVIRTGISRGFRAPQAFDEDLHIDMVGGEALFVRLSDDLQAEHSFAYQVRYDIVQSRFRFGVEGFFTQVFNPFINVLIAENEDTEVLEKRNAEAQARVYGINLEANMRISTAWEAGMGATFQRALYSSPVNVAEEEEVFSERMLRTPDIYGFTYLKWQPKPFFSLRSSLNFTGPMDVLYQGEFRDIGIERTPSFSEIDILAFYTIPFAGKLVLEANAGLRNLSNAFQQDFESGRDRDATYVFGPMRPRMFTMGLQLKFM